MIPLMYAPLRDRRRAVFRRCLVLFCLLFLTVPGAVWRLALAAVPVAASRGMVVSQDGIASEVGSGILRAGGSAVDAAVATAFALAVTHPAAGNIGGGGFMVTWDQAKGEAVAYDFRETAPRLARVDMFMTNGVYDFKRHHDSHLSVGVPGSVAGLHLAWKEQGRLPWKRLLAPAIRLAEKGFPVSDWLAGSLASIVPRMAAYPASVAQFTRAGRAYAPGDILKQPDLGRTLRRIADEGPDGFYRGRTADLIEREMRARGGWIRKADLADYRAVRRVPVRGDYRGFQVVSMPPPSSGGTALIGMLNILEGYDLAAAGFGSSTNVHRIVEAMRRAFADRARFMGDPDHNPGLPLSRLLSKEHGAAHRATIHPARASRSHPDRFEWPPESDETTHLSVMDSRGDAVALTTTLEDSYGSRIVVPGGGFLLNNEMGDFNPVPGLTTTNGMIGTSPNLTAPGKRMLSSMTPTLVLRDGRVCFVIGSPGGRTIINSVLLTLLNVVDFGMNIQEAVDAPRFHHQWLPDQLLFERRGLSPDTSAALARWGHQLQPIGIQGLVQAIARDPKTGRLYGAPDRRAPDSGAAGW